MRDTTILGEESKFGNLVISGGNCLVLIEHVLIFMKSCWWFCSSLTHCPRVCKFRCTKQNTSKVLNLD